jgi:hypothetical protein
MENARQRVNQTTIDIMRASRVQPGGMPGYGMPQQVRVCACVCICACVYVCALATHVRVMWLYHSC